MDLPARIGKYELQEFLGGGMSHVYRAKDTILGRTVALKILTEAGVADHEAKQRFLQEARLASNISHENILNVYDFGEEQGRPFIVMEFLRGESLRDAIKGGHTGDLTRKLGVALQIARALDYIHQRKIIHRDIKPENINIDPAGKVKLMDFGIAKSEGVQLTRVGFTLGTPYYMAPEQVLGQQITSLVDVYAFGVMLFELLSGDKPISGETVERIFNQILYEPLNLEPLRAIGVPESVYKLIYKCTAKVPTQRYQSFAEVSTELQRILEQPLTPAAAPPPPPAATRGAAPPPPGAKGQAPAPAAVRQQPAPVAPAAGNTNLPAFMQALPPALRNQTGLIILTTLVVLIVMMGLFFVFRGFVR